MPRTLRLALCTLALLAVVTGPVRPAGAATAVLSVSPASADIGTTVDVTVKGSGFTSGSWLHFGEAAIGVTNTVIVDDTTITATITLDPSATTRGLHNVSVVGPNQTQVTCTGCFTVTGIELHAITPTQVTRGEVTTLTLTGSGFTPDTKVYLNDPAAVVTSWTYLSPSQMRATIAVAADHPAPRLSGVGVILPTGAYAGCECFTIVEKSVTITSVTPNRVPQTGPLALTIKGTGFLDHWGTSVTIGSPEQSPFPGSPQVTVIRWQILSSTEISVEIGASLALRGAYNVAVNNHNGGSANCIKCLVVGRSGYWMVEQAGTVHGFGEAPEHGGRTNAAIADLEPAGTSDSYWLVDRAGVVSSHGPQAQAFGGIGSGALRPGEEVTSMSGLPAGNGYWLFTTAGRVFPFGAARHLGDMGATRLNGPVLDSVATPSGAGYYMVASDGGIFTFGDALFNGSMGGKPLNAPVQSLVPVGGGGYWSVASDGGVFAFGAPFRGSMGGQRLNRPVTGMVRYGNGYLMVATDGGIFNFSDLPYLGSLGASPPRSPIVAVAALA